MNRYIDKGKECLKAIAPIFKKFILNFKGFLFKQYHRNIYTQILFTNITCFFIFFIIITMLFDFSVKHTVYSQIEQELMQKATRVNYALIQHENLQKMITSENKGDDFSKPQYQQIKFLSEIFGVKITIFDKSGNIVLTSAQEEVVPGTRVNEKFIEIISSGETTTTKANDPKTSELTFVAVVPMGNSKDEIVNGILLEYTPTQISNRIARTRMFLILGEVILLIIVIFVSVSQAMQISKPISKLSTYITEINSGNYIKEKNPIITDEIKILHEQLNKLVEKMQSMEREIQNVEDGRAKLFADISHELRTPLTTIQGFTEAIHDGVIKDKDLLDKYIEIIYSQTIHINRLIDDMLQLSRLESGSIMLEKTPLDLAAVAAHVVNTMENTAKSVNTNITFESSINQAIILGDVDRIEQIIRNLIQNAINATENGNIVVSISSFNNKYILSIKDDGIGIAQEDIPHIWERFYQSKTQRSNPRKKQGSGLGLAIVKQLVQLHDGTIHVESKLGIGTAFYIHFPAL